MPEADRVKQPVSAETRNLSEASKAYHKRRNDEYRKPKQFPDGVVVPSLAARVVTARPSWFNENIDRLLVGGNRTQGGRHLPRDARTLPW